MTKLFGFSRDDPRRPYRLMPIGITLGLVLFTALALTAGLAYLGFVLLGFPGPTQEPPAPLDVVKTAFAAVAGVGGVVALVVAYRRQKVTERGQDHAEHDATERRVTELYGQAVEQLGHEKAAVRLGGLYSLERLAQDHREHRQTVVDVVCAYLRMPFQLPADDPAESAPPHSEQQAGTDTQPLSGRAQAKAEQAEAKQELQVRLAAQRLLTRHLHIPATASPEEAPPEPPDTYWDGVRIDLTNALLIDFHLDHCRPEEADFTGATFSGDAVFEGASFSGDAVFEGASFSGSAVFHGATFSGDASFTGATFSGDASFTGATFSGDAVFFETSFSTAAFGGVSFGGGAVFANAIFSGDAVFRRAAFGGGGALFIAASFGGNALFAGAAFTEAAHFMVATFSGKAEFDEVTFNGTAELGSVMFKREPTFTDAMASQANDGHTWPEPWQVERPPSGKGAGQLVRRSDSSSDHAAEDREDRDD